MKIQIQNYKIFSNNNHICDFEFFFFLIKKIIIYLKKKKKK